jgi:hypothetical protein
MPARSTVWLYRVVANGDDVFLGSTTANAQGAYSFSNIALVAGENVLRAYSVGADGSPLTQADLVLTSDRSMPPNIPGQPVLLVNGELDYSGTTSNTTPTLRVNLASDAKVGDVVALRHVTVEIARATLTQADIDAGHVDLTVRADAALMPGVPGRYILNAVVINESGVQGLQGVDLRRLAAVGLPERAETRANAIW